MKKLLAFIASFAMVFTLLVSGVSAADTYTLTIKDTKEGHTYDVYQIFTGDISGSYPNYVLSNVKYGYNFENAGETVPEEELKQITDADAFAQSVQTINKPFKSNIASVDGQTVIDGLPAGYYLVVETTESITGQDAYTKRILQVVGNTTIQVKSDVPTAEKKVKENEKTVTGSTDDRIPGYNVGYQYNDVADYNIGDAVPFKLIGTLPSNYDDYDTYKYIFHDTLSTGLTYNNDVKVYVDNGGSLVEIKDGFTSNLSDNELAVEFANLKKIESVNSSSKIVVEYTAILNDGATIGLNGNENKVYLEFSNNPNSDGSGDTGKTTEDKVIVFTYELDVTKTDGDGIALANAEFKLLNSDKTKVAEISNNIFSQWLDIETDNEGNITNGTTLTSGEDGVFIIKGLDSGTYYLKETKAPEGYNLLTNEIQLDIIATTVNDQSWEGKDADEALTKLEITTGGKTTEGNVNSGIVNATVVNNAGSTLPSTGGMGTTLFYVVGAILVAGAAFIVIKRKKAEE